MCNPYTEGGKVGQLFLDGEAVRRGWTIPNDANRGGLSAIFAVGTGGGFYTIRVFWRRVLTQEHTTRGFKVTRE